MNSMQQFDRIMGDCCGVDMAKLTAADVREQAELWNRTETGPQITETEVLSAIEGLCEYQENDN